MPATKLIVKKSVPEQLLSQERRSECFPVSIGVCPASSAEKLPETDVKAWRDSSLRRVALESAIVDFFQFCLRNRLTGSDVFIAILTIEQSLLGMCIFKKLCHKASIVNRTTSQPRN